MAITITHATVASDPQDPLLGADEWNANHTLSGSIAWGEITGTISGQTDLQTALDAKASLSGAIFTGNISALNLSGTNTGDQDLSGYLTISSAASTYAPINSPTFTGTITGGTIQATGSGGITIKTNSSADVLHLGNGGVNATAYGGWNFDGATANTIASFGASKTLTSLSTATYPSLTELSYVKGVTSAIQTQMDGKQPDIQFKDEGVNAGSSGGVSVIDFVGSGVSVAESSGTLTVTISSGGGSVTAADVSVTSTNFFTISSTDAQAAFAEIDQLLKYGNIAQPNGWTIISEDFRGSTTIGDYCLTSRSAGSGSLGSIITSALATQKIMGYINLSTGTTTTGRGGVSTQFPIYSASNFKSGDKLYAQSAGVRTSAASDGTNTYDMIACWMCQGTASALDETTAASFQAYFRGNSADTNWQFVYNDDTSTQIVTDTGIAIDSAGENTTFEIVITFGATNADHTIAARINGASVTLSDPVGLRAFIGDNIHIWPGRISKSAGSTARLMYIDIFSYGIYTPDRWG